MPFKKICKFRPSIVSPATATTRFNLYDRFVLEDNQVTPVWLERRRFDTEFLAFADGRFHGAGGHGKDLGAGVATNCCDEHEKAAEASQMSSHERHRNRTPEDLETEYIPKEQAWLPKECPTVLPRPFCSRAIA